MLHKNRMMRFLAICLIITAFLSTPAFAAENAARYIDLYNGYIFSAGNGEIHVCAEVDAPYTIDELGMAMVLLYECPTNSTNEDDWECIYIYYCNIFPEMVAYNTSSYLGYVTWEDGIVGYYYKAQITIFAEQDGTTESRTIITPAKRATYFAENT